MRISVAHAISFYGTVSLYFLLCPRLLFEAAGNTYRDKDGVTVEVPGFGGTETVQFLNTDNAIHIPYFNDFVNYFVNRGYVSGVSIRAAPYDWRLAAGEH